MRIDGHKVVVKKGYPDLVVQTELGEMRIGLEQKLADRGYIFVEGPAAEKLPEIELPADESIGQGPLTLRGFTDDAEIARLYRQFMAEQG